MLILCRQTTMLSKSWYLYCWLPIGRRVIDVFHLIFYKEKCLEVFYCEVKHCVHKQFV